MDCSIRTSRWCTSPATSSRRTSGSTFFGLGSFDYHRIEIDEKTTLVSIEGDAAELTRRGIFNATIHGARNPWTLQFSMRFAKRGAKWIITHARYTTF